MPLLGKPLNFMSTKMNVLAVCVWKSKRRAASNEMKTLRRSVL